MALIDAISDNPAEYTAPEKLPDEITQSFTISCTIRPNDRDDNGQMPQPVMSFKPEGNGVSPDDCLSLALAGAQWANAARVKLQEKVMAHMAERAKSRIILPGNKGMSQ